MTKIKDTTDACTGISSKPLAFIGNEKKETKKSERLLLKFPEQLMHLLDSEAENDSMWWFKDGTGFCVVPKTANVLQKYFKASKFESFTRKLNRW
jgi:hypothetical protein